jgi:hypothetical protein
VGIDCWPERTVGGNRGGAPTANGSFKYRGPAWSQPAHQRSDLASDFELVSRTGFHDTDTFDSADRRGLGLFPSSHVHLGVVNSEGQDFDHRAFPAPVLFDYQMFHAAKSVNDYCVHKNRLAFI